MNSSVTFPFLFGQRVEIVRDTHVTDFGIDLHVPAGAVGMVVRAEPGCRPWIKFEGINRHIPIPNLHLLPVGEEEYITTRFIRR